MATTYLGRHLPFNRPTDPDQTRMPQWWLSASPHAAATPWAERPRDLPGLPVTHRADAPAQPLTRVLADSGTTAMVVANHGQLVWEHYPDPRFIE